MLINIGQKKEVHDENLQERVDIRFIIAVRQSGQGEIKNKSFTPEEIKKMSETKATIETKLGNIELRFFPDVAPNHVNNFIELAKKGFMMGPSFIVSSRSS